MPTKRSRDEQAAYMREYRARKKTENEPPLTGVSGALIDTHGSSDIANWTVKPRAALERPATPPDIHAACDARIAALQAEVDDLRGFIDAERGGKIDDWEPAAKVVRTGTEAYGERMEQKPTFLAAPDDDCGRCGHGWHNTEDGCKAPDGSIGRQRPCGCKQYHAGPLF